MAYKDPSDERLKASRRKHYYSNKEQYRKRNEDSRNQKREFIRKAKDVPCEDCGERYPYYVMDFDHRDPSEKVENVARLINWGWKRLRDEIKKCDIVCSNCHRRRTHERTSGG